MSLHRYPFARPLIAVAMVAASTLVAFAQKPPVPTRVRGAIESVDGDVLTVKSRSGEDVKLHMTGDIKANLSRSDDKDICQPALRVGQRQELGWAATFLASPYAQFISGHTLVVDGANWQRLDHFMATHETLELDTRLEMIRQLAEALDHAHRRHLYHRALAAR